MVCVRTFDEIVTIFTSKPAGKLLVTLGDADGTALRHVRDSAARPKFRTEAATTLFNVVEFVAKSVTCVVGKAV